MPYAPVNDLSMYYEVHGDGPPLILLHGAYMTVDMMAPARRRARAGAGQVIVRRACRAHGAHRRRRPPDHLRADGRRRRRARCATSGSSRPTSPASAWAARTALQLAIRHPALVRRLVVASASFRYDGMPAEALAMFPSITPELFAGSPMETEYQRLAPNPGDFPTLVEKLKELDTTDFAWPDEDIRAIAAPTLIVLGDSDGVRLEHAVEHVQAARRRRDGRPLRDARSRSSRCCPAPRTSSRPAPGVLDRADWLLAMIASRPPRARAAAGSRGTRGSSRGTRRRRRRRGCGGRRRA